MALLGPRAAVLQNMLPALGQGVEDHSVWFEETLARLARSIPPIFGTVYGPDPTTTGHEVRDFHTSIKGKLPDELGGPYSALNPDTYYWAHATFVEHLVIATDTFIRPLAVAEKDQLIAESVTWFERYGVSARGIPTHLGRVRGLLGRRARAPPGPAPHRGVRRRVRHQGLAAAAGRSPRPLWWLVRRPVNAFSALRHDRRHAAARPARSSACRGTTHRERRYRRFARAVRALDPLLRRLPPRLRLHPIAARAFAREAGR